jgi:hypothetical protein
MLDNVSLFNGLASLTSNSWSWCKVVNLWAPKTCDWFKWFLVFSVKWSLLNNFDTKICVYALLNCWWFMCMHFILFGGKGGQGIWMVVKGPKRDSISFYGAKIWEESANKFKWAYKGGLRKHAKRGTLWMPFVCILPFECPYLGHSMAYAYWNSQCKKNIYEHEEMKKRKEKGNPEWIV